MGVPLSGDEDTQRYLEGSHTGRRGPHVPVRERGLEDTGLGHPILDLKPPHCEKTNPCCLSHLGCSICNGSPSKLTHFPITVQKIKL